LNEEAKIARVVIAAQKVVDKVIVCDDGSRDMTGEIAGKLGATVIRHQSNLGKGVALKDLFGAALGVGADIIVTLDGDGQHDPMEIPGLVKEIKSGVSDIVIGSRIHDDNMPSHRRLGNKVLDGVTNAASGLNVRDTQSGFRAYSRHAIEEIDVTEHGLGADSQILMSASRAAMRIREVPVRTIYGDETPSSSSTKQGLHVLVTVIRTVVEKSPLVYLGLPGLILGIGGILSLLNLLQIYNVSHYFSLPVALIALGGIVLGAMLVVSAMILYAIGNLVVRLRENPTADS
jgi:glycosyltransferase involved in cell wall biosynthesis